MQVLEPQTPPAPPPPRLPPPRTAKPRSRLGWLVLSVIALALGVLGLIDLAGAPVPGAAYLAVPLAVVGLGLVVGAWYGHARWLIALGVVLSAVLGIATAAEDVGTTARSATWRPISVEQLDGSYTIDIGNALLDLSAVDFTGRSEAVQIRVGVGNLNIILPSNVDTEVAAAVDVGNATVFGTRWGGIGQPERTVRDVGADGPGGGELVIHATVDVGDLEVRR